MSNPFDIPDDIWADAGLRINGDASLLTHDAVVEFAARCIMAERERCANLAEDIDIDLPEWTNVDDPQAVLDQARIKIAFAIRGEV